MSHLHKKQIREPDEKLPQNESSKFKGIWDLE